MRQVILDALEDRYNAQISEADATLKIYLEHSVGIGEHPQHLDEVDKLIEESLIEKRESNFNNEECLFCDQIDNNIEEYDATSKQKREAINMRWHGNKEGKKKANKYENDNLLKVQPEVQALLDKGKEDENKEVTYDPDNLPF